MWLISSAVAGSTAADLRGCAALEHHFECDPEKEQATGDAEGGERYAEKGEHVLAEQREGDEHDGRHDGGAERNSPAVGDGHAGRYGDEQRRQPDRIERDEQRDDGVQQIVEHPRPLVSWQPSWCQRAKERARGWVKTITIMGARESAPVWL